MFAFDRMGHLLEELTRRTVFHLGPLAVSSTVVHTWVIMAALGLVLAVFTRRLSADRPGPVQQFLEMLYEFVEGLVAEVVGHEGKRFLPFVGALFLFILVLNLSWLIPGMIPPTSDPSTTLALAVCTLLVAQVAGIRAKGFGGYARGFLEPVPVMAFLTVIEEFFTKPFSLAVRLFGNVFAEELVIGVFFLLVPLLVPTLIQFMGLLFGTVQALIFATLAATYISQQVHGH